MKNFAFVVFCAFGILLSSGAKAGDSTFAGKFGIYNLVWDVKMADEGFFNDDYNITIKISDFGSRELLNTCHSTYTCGVSAPCPQDVSEWATLTRIIDWKCDKETPLTVCAVIKCIVPVKSKDIPVYYEYPSGKTTLGRYGE